MWLDDYQIPHDELFAPTLDLSNDYPQNYALLAITSQVSEGELNVVCGKRRYHNTPLMIERFSPYTFSRWFEDESLKIYIYWQGR